MSSDYINKYKNRLGRNGNNNGDVFMQNTISFIESTFADSPTYRLVQVDSSQFTDIKQMDVRVEFVETMGTLKDLLFKPYEGLNIGTYVNFDNDTWLLFDQWGDRNQYKYRARVTKCNRQLKWIDKDGVTQSIWCNASQTPLGAKSRQDRDNINYNTFDVDMPSGRLYVFAEKNTLTETVHMNQRFVFGNRVYEVVGVDDMTYVDKDGYGVMQFQFALTTIRDGDDFTNGIALNEYDTTIQPEQKIVDPNNQGNGGRIW